MENNKTFNYEVKETISKYPNVEKQVSKIIDENFTGYGVSPDYLQNRRKQEIIDFIALLRRLHPDVEYAGQNGKCFIVSKILRSKFGGEIWYDTPGHITTKIDGVHYDITGEVSPRPSAYLLNDELMLQRAEHWDDDWRDKRTLNFLMNNGTYSVKCEIIENTEYTLFVEKHGSHYATYTVHDPNEAQKVLKDLGFTEVMFKISPPRAHTSATSVPLPPPLPELPQGGSTLRGE